MYKYCCSNCVTKDCPGKCTLTYTEGGYNSDDNPCIDCSENPCLEFIGADGKGFEPYEEEENED
jgi:hypothetical protein